MTGELGWPSEAGSAPVRALLFDVDGTLYRQGPLRVRMLVAMAAAAVRRPRGVTREARAVAAYRSAQEELRATNTVYADLAAEQVRIASKRCGLPPALVAGAVDRWMEHAPLRALAGLARPGLHRLLEVCSESGIALGIVSDYPARAKLEALGVAERFHTVVCAQDPEVGAFKPNPMGLQVALRRMGVAAENALYVGDRRDVDGGAARAAGIRCVIVEPESTQAGAVRDFVDLRSRLFGPSP